MNLWAWWGVHLLSAHTFISFSSPGSKIICLAPRSPKNNFSFLLLGQNFFGIVLLKFNPKCYQSSAESMSMLTNSLCFWHSSLRQQQIELFVFYITIIKKHQFLFEISCPYNLIASIILLTSVNVVLRVRK